MRALALHSDLIVFISRVWQTTSTALRVGDEGFLIDSVVYPDELAAVPGVLGQAGFPISGLLVTHGDWDHLLGRQAFPEATLGCGEATAERLQSEMGAPQRRLREFDEEHYVDGRTPLSLASLQALPVPGKLEIGGGHGSEARELELYPTPGHTADGVAFWLPWQRTLICGDYLSPVEIPMLSPGGGIDAYLATLDTLEPLVAQASNVIPGHGAPQSGIDAHTILRQDRAYLQGLKSGADAAIPDTRRTAQQRTIHIANAAFVHGADAD